MKNYNKALYEAICKRKTQNTQDYEFKKLIKETDPLLYRKTVAEVNRIEERRRIINIIKSLEFSYRMSAKKAKVKLKSKYAHKILAMHELLYRLGEER